jgi:hypothetical protein
MSKFLIIFGVIGSIRYIIQDFTQAIAGAAKGIFKLTEEAAKLRDSEVAFQRLAGAGQDANVILARVYAETEGVIERVQAVGATTRAALAGLPMDRFDQLAKGARVLAAATGRDANEALERLTNAVAKQERRLLDELGIVVRAQDIYKDYAKSIGVAASELTASQKKMAFFDTVVKSVNEKVMALGGNVDLAQRPFKRLRASAKDLQIAFGGFLERTLNVSSVVQDISDSLSSLTDRFSSVSERSAVAVAELLKTSDAIDMLSTQVPKMVKEAKSLIDVLNSTTTTTDETREAQERLNEITKSLAGLFPELARELETNLAGALAKVSKATKLQTKLQLTLYKIQLSEAIEKTSDAYEEAAKNVDKYKSRVDVLKDATMKLADGEEKCQLDLAEFTKIQRGSLAGLSMMVHPLGRLSVGFEDLTNELSKQSSKLVAANSQLSLMRQRIASLVKVQLKMGEVTEDDVDAFAHADEGTARYRKALINIASAIGEHTDLIEDAREEIIAMTQATEEAGKQTRKTAEEITKSIENISKDWKSLGELIKKIRFEFDLSEIEKAQLDFDILRGQETEAFDEVEKNIHVHVKDTDSAFDDILAKYKEYLIAKSNISKVEDEATKKRLSDNLAIFKKSIDKGLAELKLNESEVAKIAETRITIAREEAAEKKTFTAEELASFRENESAMTATLHENLRMRSGDTSATLEDIIKKYKDYVNASLAIANIENFAIRQAREKDLANFKDAIDARLAALGIEEKVIIELINSRTVAIEAESKIREAKAKEIEDLANKEIKAGEPVYETEVERAKRVLSVWQNVLNGLKRQGFERTKEYEKVNDLVLQSERNLAKAIRKIEVEKNRKRIQSELEVLQTLSSAAQELPTMSQQKAKELIAQLKASSAELPPYLNQVVTQMKNMLSDLADHNNRVNKEVRDNYILALDEQFNAAIERRKKDIESYGELKDEVEKIEKAKTDFVIKNAGNEVVAAQNAEAQ